MATLKTANGKSKYFDNHSRYDVLHYILRQDKTPDKLYGSNLCDITTAAAQMDNTAARFNKANGVKLRHFIISFDPHELNHPLLVYEIAKQISLFFYSEYQTVFAVHQDKAHLHIHIVINSVSFTDGHRYYGKRAEFNALKAHIKKILHGYGMHTLIYIPNESY